jgi:hypothetical protein
MGTSKSARAAPGVSRCGPQNDLLGGEIKQFNKAGPRQAQELIAAIDTGHASQVRVQISTWRDHTKIEIKPYSATIPQCFMPCGAGVSIDVAKADELIEAIRTARAHHTKGGN